MVEHKFERYYNVRMNEKLKAKYIDKMIGFYGSQLHDVEHFLRVWSYAKVIGVEEGLDEATQDTLELAAIVHDIACPLCREKYGNTNGKYQEREGERLAREFYSDLEDKEKLERICFLVGHHHTFRDISGMDYQILVEADFLVNASESHYSQTQIENFKKNVFRTKTGLRLLETLYDCS